MHRPTTARSRAERSVTVRMRPQMSVNDGPSLTDTALSGEVIVHLPTINVRQHVESGASATPGGVVQRGRALHVLITPGRRQRSAVRALIGFTVALTT